jgi:hypothetical protein
MKKQNVFEPRIQLLHANQIIVVEKRKVKIGLAVFLLLSLILAFCHILRSSENTDSPW